MKSSTSRHLFPFRHRLQVAPAPQSLAHAQTIENHNLVQQSTVLLATWTRARFQRDDLDEQQEFGFWIVISVQPSHH